MSRAFALALLPIVSVLVACDPPPDEGDVPVDGGPADAAPDAPPPRSYTLWPVIAEERMGFGAAMAQSGDTLVVGATSAPARIGSAYVFVRRADRWEQQAKLSGGPGALAFAMDVAIDGDTIAVSEQMPGATFAEGPRNQVRVFGRRGDTWTETTVLAPSRPSATFGWGMAIQRDEMVIGGGGAARVYARDGATWTERAALVPPGTTPGALFGRAIAIDGDRLVVGDDNAGGPSGDITGAVYVFERDGGAWQFRQVIAPAFPGVWPHDVDFGVSLALRGPRLAIGMHDFCPTAKVYELSGSAWSEVATLDPKHETCVEYAYPDVAMAGDRIAIGATGFAGGDGLPAGQGAGYLFEKTTAGWSGEPVERLHPLGSATAGASIVLTDGELLVGAPRAGSVFVFELARR